MGAPGAVMNSGVMDIARAAGACPQRLTSTAKHQGAEVNEEDAGDACRRDKDQSLLCAIRHDKS
jgi:hypothetical protein